MVPKDKLIPPNTIWVHGKAIPRRERQPEIVKHQVIGGPPAAFPEEDEDDKEPSSDED